MIYELRTYTFFPGKMQDFVAAFEVEALAILAPRLRGFWRSENGSLNRAVHLWEFEDRDGRARIKSLQAPTLAAYAAKVLPLMRKQQSRVFEGELNTPDASGEGVFDLISLELPPFTDEPEIVEFREVITAWLSRHLRVVAALRGECDGAGEFVWLVRSDSLRDRDENWRRAMSSRPAHAQAAKTMRLKTDLLLPLSFSPLR